MKSKQNRTYHRNDTQQLR